MATEQTPLTFLALMQELQRFCIEKRTGTMFIATEDNHLARIVLEDGIIISLSFHTKRGIAALDLIKAIKSGTFKFDKVKFLVGGPQQLPPSSEILHMLLDDTLAIGVGQGGTVSKIDLLRAIELVERELARYIGPMADVICREHFEYVHTLPDVWAMLDSIAAEIGDAALELQFKQDVLKKAEMLQADFIQSAIDDANENAVQPVNEDSQTISAEETAEIAEVKELVQQQLIQIIGPMGKIICADYLDGIRSIGDITAVISKIAREIDDPLLERQFIDNVSAKIRLIN